MTIKNKNPYLFFSLALSLSLYLFYCTGLLLPFANGKSIALSMYSKKEEDPRLYGRVWTKLGPLKPSAFQYPKVNCFWLKFYWIRYLKPQLFQTSPEKRTSIAVMSCPMHSHQFTSLEAPDNHATQQLSGPQPWRVWKYVCMMSACMSKQGF